MLILCPECESRISDKAISCPHCGLPMKQINSAHEEMNPLKKASTRSKRHRRKLPNGYGSIQKLSGRRSHPYAAYPPTKEFTEAGSPVRQNAVGYYETWYAAYDALVEYNKITDQEREEQAKKLMSLTFEDMYKLYYNSKFRKEIDEGRKVSMMGSMAAAFKNCSSIHKEIYSSLRKDDFQKVIDDCPKKYSSKELIKTLYRQMAAFAIENDYIEKDYSQFAHLTGEDDDENGVPFTEDEIKKLWKDSADSTTRIILIMCYTGFRISAFNNMKVDLEKKCFTGGVKTKASKSRSVPFHKKIVPFISADMFDEFNANVFREKFFYPKMIQLGISHTSDGIKHTPHDTRHTFSWLCDMYQVDEISKHLLMGHKLKGDVEKAVYSHRTYKELQDAIERIDDPKYRRDES